MIIFLPYVVVLILMTTVFNTAGPLWHFNVDLYFAQADGDPFFVPVVSSFLISLIVTAVVYVIVLLES